MQSNTCLVKFSFVCPHCRNVNTKLKTVKFTRDFGAKTCTNSVRLICAHCGLLATRIVLEELGPASLDAEQFEEVNC